MFSIQLKVKIKVLAAEALILRQQEKKYLPEWRLRADATYFSLRHHRVEAVRKEQRSALLAYGYMRGRAYAQMEKKCYEKPNLERVLNIVQRFTPPDPNVKAEPKEMSLARLKAWVEIGHNRPPEVSAA
jgi:hypothetical protein